jgi:hypothetical protein
MTDWRDIVVSPCRTHHLTLCDRPAYKERYKRVYQFNEGYAVVENEEGEFHIKPDGTRLYPKTYKQALPFSDGFAKVTDYDGKSLYFNSNGEIIYNLRVIGSEIIYELSKWYIVTIKKQIVPYCKKKQIVPDCKELRVSECRTHHVFPDGTPAYIQRYKRVGRFIENVAVAEDKKGWFHISHDGSEAYHYRYEETQDFNDGLAVARDGYGLFIIKLDGSRLFEGSYDSIRGKNDVIEVRDKYGDMFMFNTKGEMINGKLDDLENVSIDWKELRRSECGTHHVFPDGTPAYPQRYVWVSNLSEGFARAEDKSGWFHIKPDGTPAYPQRYVWVNNFSEGFARVEDKSGWYTINTKGERW